MFWQKKGKVSSQKRRHVQAFPRPHSLCLKSFLCRLAGEILPQAVCKRYGLAIGAFMAWPIRILMILTFIISWPISKLLDWLLGDGTEGALFRRAELRVLVSREVFCLSPGLSVALR